MNRVFVVGNITGDIYFDRFLIKNEKRSFLRLVLMAEQPRAVRGMRVVLWDQKAELYFPYLKKGSELAVLGQFQSRTHKGKLVHEVVSENLLLLRKIDWERGERLRLERNLPAVQAAGNDAFVVGELTEEPHFAWRARREQHGGGEFALLRLSLACDEYLPGLQVSVHGALAELAQPYLQTGSKIAVDGHLQSRKREAGEPRIELTARNMTFLDNINWAAGEAARRLDTKQPQEEQSYAGLWVGD